MLFRLLPRFACALSVLLRISTASLTAADNGAASASVTNFTEAAAALRKFAVAPNFKVEVFASEPFLQNPVSFAFDEKGRLYVVETHRRRTSVFDIRKFPEWLDSDFS